MFNKLVVEVKKEMVIERGRAYVGVFEDGTERIVAFYANKSYKKDIAVAIDITSKEIICLDSDINNVVSKFTNINKCVGVAPMELYKSMESIVEMETGGVFFILDENNNLKQRRVFMGLGKMITINPETSMITSRVRDNIADLMKGYDFKFALNIA